MSELEVIDAVLAGEPVDPEFAELAELALLLRAERPAPETDVATRLDATFARLPSSPLRPTSSSRRFPGRWWVASPVAGVLAAFAVAIVIATSSGSHAISRSPAKLPVSTSSAASAHASSTGSAASGATPLAQARARRSPSSTVAAGAPAPPVTFPGRLQIESSELYLSTPPRHMEDVAHEVLFVVRKYGGYVNNSTVTASGGSGGYSEFELTVPSSDLQFALGELSNLQFTQIVSRTDTTSDVTNQYNSANSELNQAQALRTSLLKQLQSAVTDTQTRALQAQLSDANAKIASARATLRSLNRQVSYSQISLTVGSRYAPAPVGSGGFTIGKAARDAGRVLTVAAGVALIALAVLVPIGLLLALAWWIAVAVRRHRREQALDMA
jgi:hypothetical protein